MKRLTVRRMPTSKGPTDINISPYPTRPLSQLPPSQEQGTPVLNALANLPKLHIHSQFAGVDNHQRETIIDALLTQDRSSLKGSWTTFLMNLGFTHFCTITFSHEPSKALAYKLLNEFRKHIARTLLGRNFATVKKRESQPLIFAFMDRGSDAKTSRKLRRFSRETQAAHPTRRITYGKNPAVHFHLLVRFTKINSAAMDKTHTNILEKIPGMWLDIGETYAASSDTRGLGANYCDSADIAPIRDNLKSILYCLKNISALPVNAHQVIPPTSPSASTTQITTEAMAS